MIRLPRKRETCRSDWWEPLDKKDALRKSAIRVDSWLINSRMISRVLYRFCDGRTSYKRVFDGNRLYVQRKLAEDPKYFDKLSQGQHPQYLLIGCSDSRVPPNELTQTQPGEMFIHRNVANQVLPADMNVNSVIQFAIEGLKVKNIIVMGHTQCGGVKAACEGHSHGGFLDMWLSHVKNIYNQNQSYLDSLNFDERVNTLVTLNVKEQVRNVWKNPYIQKAWREGNQIWVHGWVIKLESGLVEEVQVDECMPEALKVFKYKFEK